MDYRVRACINLGELITWTAASSEDFPLSWRDDACPRLAALNGQQLDSIEVLECAGGETDFASDMVPIAFGFTDGRITITTALDANAIEFGPPHPNYHSHRYTTKTTGQVSPEVPGVPATARITPRRACR